ncbi:cytochrome P450 [Hoyosella altamirensis]|uniref:Pentalenolactone synthase n=1 Tax=Hoyosella altamirensis TaxID=616997 RepID=A0A839RKP2_9ACTN|nr:cytochrome P450 [Hoyosella altamirensis]MBB3036561.1 pentalenolactone synthase [Hoyosella altamirensis]
MDAPPSLSCEPIEVFGVPQVLSDLRAQSPISRVITEVGDQAWLVSRYSDVHALLTDPRLGRTHPQPEAAARMTNSALFGGPLGNYDTEDGDHAHMRAQLLPAFSPARLRALQQPVQELANNLLDHMEESGPPVDLHEMVSFPLPVLVICELLGVPADDRDTFRRWSEEIADTLDGDRSQRGLTALVSYMRELVTVKRQRPGADLISDLIATSSGTTDVDAVAMLSAGMLFAGHETTVVRLDIGALLLITHPSARERLLSSPQLIPSAVEEVLRYLPSGAILPRYARSAIQLDDVTITPGDLVLLDLSSANHDERTFSKPNDFDITRTPNRHVTFGHGPRYCIGAALARLELQTTLRMLLQRFPALELAVQPHELRRKTHTLTGGLETLPVRW